MSESAASQLRPIRGEPLGEPPKHKRDLLAKLHDRSLVAGLAFRAFRRYSHAKVGLLAAGTTYYLFIALFALVALGYGIAALVSSDELQSSITDGLNEAFPGLIGQDGLDPDTLRQSGQAASLLGLVLMLYSGSGALGAASTCVHRIYASRNVVGNFLVTKLRLIAWLLVLAPMILISYLLSGAVVTFGKEVNERLGLAGDDLSTVVTLSGIAAAIVFNFLIVFLLLGHFGGIRPHFWPRCAGAVVGALGIEILKYSLAVIVGYSVDRPQYGAFGVPITVLLILYLQTTTLYVAASVTAGMSEVPPSDWGRLGGAGDEARQDGGEQGAAGQPDYADTGSSTDTTGAGVQGSTDGQEPEGDRSGAAGG